MGLMHYFHRVEVLQQRKGISIYQTKYFFDLLKRFRMPTCTIVTTSIALCEKLTKDDLNAHVDPILYICFVGSLMYLITIRPNIMYVVSLIS